MIKDALSHSSDLQTVKDELDTLRQKKRALEAGVKSQFERELTRLDDLSVDLESELAELSDLVLLQIAKGEIVKVHDDYNRTYDVAIKLSFRKSDEQ